MSVVENPTIEQTSRGVQQQFAIGSAVGAAAVLTGLWLIFAALPLGWSWGWDSLWANNKDMRENLFLADALLILLDLALIGGLVYCAYQALQQYTLPGLRAGIVLAALYLFLCAWFALWLGTQLQDRFDENAALGWTVLAVVVSALIGGAGFVYLTIPAFLGFMETVEHQGWLHATSYKGNQGVRVRRGTIVGILAVGMSGIITMVMHRFFGVERNDVANDWYWVVPFYHPTQIFHLMFKVHLMMPIVLGVALLWLAWRVVNIPVFADFLIATEAEMNKVSWTNRRRLMQDTVVVLTTVFLFTMFLFVVDIIWIKVLSAPYIQVLLYDPREKQQQQQETAKW